MDPEDNAEEPETEVKYDFMSLWRSPVIDSGDGCFLADEKRFIKNSFVYKAFRSEFEVERAFCSTGLTYLKKQKNHQIQDPKDEEASQKKLPLTAIPGYSPLSCFHKKSVLNREEMTEFFDLFKLLKEGKLNNNQLKKYNVFKEKVIAEEKEYLELAKNVWERENHHRHKEIFPEVDECVNYLWKVNLERLEKYPKFYSQVGLFSLMSPNANQIEMNLVKVLKNVGKPVAMFFPKLTMFKANVHSVISEVRREQEVKMLGHSTMEKDTTFRYNPEISKDETAEKFALENDVHLVISESGLLCLLNNHYPRFENSWDLPVTIKEHTLRNGGKKKVVYIDKALTPRSLNNADKNRWYCKRGCDIILRNKCSELRIPINESTGDNMFDMNQDISELETFGVDVAGKNCSNKTRNQTLCDACKSNRASADQENVSNGANDTMEGVVQEPEEANQCFGLALQKEDKSSSDESSDDQLMIVDETETDAEEKPKKIKTKQVISTVPWNSKSNSVSLPAARRCTCRDKIKEDNPKNALPAERNKPRRRPKTYSLWTLRKDCQQLLSKTNTKDFNIIIRCKDGYVNKKQPGKKFKISTKVEYQSEFGAETLTLNEIIRQWGSLVIRPGTDLLEVRLNPLNGELIMFQSRNIHEVIQESIRLYNVKPSLCLNMLYSIVEKIVIHEPGRYHLRHHPRNEAFVPFYKETDGAYVFGLHSSYRLEDAAPNMSVWLPIDLNIITPTFRHFRRVPGTFAPRHKLKAESKFKQVKKKTKVKPKKKKKNSVKIL